MIIWNPWHGCHKVSEGCQHCYMYFLDGKRGIDTSKVYRTENFDLPVHRRRDGRFKLLVNKLCVQYEMRGTVLIVAGDCGFGFEQKGYYENIVRRNSKRMNDANDEESVTKWLRNNGFEKQQSEYTSV